MRESESLSVFNFFLLIKGLDDLLNYEEDDEDEERSWRR